MAKAVELFRYIRSEVMRKANKMMKGRKPKDRSKVMKEAWQSVIKLRKRRR